MNDEDEIDYELLVQQMREEQEWQIRKWQDEILDQWNRYDGKGKPA